MRSTPTCARSAEKPSSSSMRCVPAARRCVPVAWRRPYDRKGPLYGPVCQGIHQEAGRDPTAPQAEASGGIQGLTVYKEYQDEASGKDANRPAWKELMLDAQEGKFAIVMAVKLDRVMRSVTG